MKPKDIDVDCLHRCYHVATISVLMPKPTCREGHWVLGRLTKAQRVAQKTPKLFLFTLALKKEGLGTGFEKSS